MAFHAKAKPYVENEAYKGMANKAGALLIAYWRLYPDRMLAFFEAEKPDYRLTPIQVIMLRAEARYKEVFFTGGRGITKSYVGLLGRQSQGSLYPGVKLPYFGPTLKQTASIISAVYRQAQKNYPLFFEGWEVQYDAAERFTCHTKSESKAHRSYVDVDMMRGTSANAVFAEEVAQQERGEAFDHEKFRAAVLPAVRLQRQVDGKLDPMFPHCQKVYVTSAGRQQNESFQYRNSAIKDMVEGRSAFCLDIPGSVAVLNRIRTIDWYNDMQRKLTPEEWLREMCARWTGTCANPVIRDSVLAESKNLMIMENRHCGNPDATYVISYDVSYAEGSRNAKCATVVLKCEPQNDPHKRDKFLKSFVYCIDEDPTSSSMQAKKLKQRWHRFCLATGQPAYIAIDARSYGQAVLEELHKDLEDGLPPLCCVNHNRQDIELTGALPLIYPINATGGYSTGYGYNDSRDTEDDMLRYAEIEWEQRNVRLLTSNINEGVLAYKRMYRIKDDINDPLIAIPYLKSREMAGQIGNLRKRMVGSGYKEERISKAVNRDMWSAAKYALRIAQRLEYQRFVSGIEKSGSWNKIVTGKSTLAEEISKPTSEYARLAQTVHPTTVKSSRTTVLNRTGGNMRR